eukprot:69615-Rhodomonas_salina.1
MPFLCQMLPSTTCSTAEESPSEDEETIASQDAECNASHVGGGGDWSMLERVGTLLSAPMTLRATPQTPGT